MSEDTYLRIWIFETTPQGGATIGHWSSKNFPNPDPRHALHHLEAALGHGVSGGALRNSDDNLFQK